MKENAREKILAAAEELFAKNGFEGTSTALIAKTAGVNSALIFYYFNSKENLLKCLISQKIDAYRKSRPIPPESFARAEMTLEILEQLLREGMIFLKSNKDIFRILIMELFKKSPVNFDVFEINHEMMTDVFSLLKREKAFPRQVYTLEVKEIFFLTLPMAAFILLEEKLATFYSARQSELETLIMDVCKDIYIRLISTDLGIVIEENGGAQ